jgi:hypothetical protein
VRARARVYFSSEGRKEEFFFSDFFARNFQKKMLAALGEA